MSPVVTTEAMNSSTETGMATTTAKDKYSTSFVNKRRIVQCVQIDQLANNNDVYQLTIEWCLFCTEIVVTLLVESIKALPLNSLDLLCQ